GAPSMPRNALRYVQADYCLPADEIGPLLARITDDGAGEKSKETMKKTTRSKSATGSKRQKKTSNGAARVSGRDELTIGDQHRASPPDDPEQDPLRCPD